MPFVPEYRMRLSKLEEEATPAMSTCSSEVAPFFHFVDVAGL